MNKRRNDRAARLLGQFAFPIAVVLLPLLVSGCRSTAQTKAATSDDVILQAPVVTAAIQPPLNSDEFARDTTHRDTQTLLRMVSQTSLGDSSSSSAEPIPRSSSTSTVFHAGITPTRFRDLTEEELVVLALGNSTVIRSLGLRVIDRPATVTTRYDPAISASDPFFGPSAALAEFDTQLAASFDTQNNDRVFNNATLGGQVQELVQDLVQFDSSIRRTTTRGTQWDLRSQYTYDSNNRAGNRFPSYWETQLEAGVRHPLLQGGGKTFNLIAGPNAQPGFNFSNGIWIARINNQISQADFNIALRDYFLDLYNAYWELRRQYVTLQAVTTARDVSYRVWQTVRSKKLSGLTGGEAYKEAQTRAEYYRYAREVQLTLGGNGGTSGLYNAERTLRRLIGLPPTDGILLRPVDLPPRARFEFDVQQAVATGLASRTELCRQQLEVRQHKLRLIAAKNFLLPQLDLYGRSRLRGFGDDLTGGGDRFDSATDDLFSLDHHEWQFGVEMGVSPPRRQAKAAVRNASLQWHRESKILEEQQAAVAFEVHEAIAEIQSAFLARESSAAQTEAAQQRLQSSQALFDAGKIQLEFLVDAADQWVQATTQWAADESRYALALVQIGRATGTLLTEMGLYQSSAPICCE